MTTDSTSETGAGAPPAAFAPATGALAALDQVTASQRGGVVHLRLNRPAKRNALSDTLVGQLAEAFRLLPESARAVVVSGEGPHFCAGLDLSEVVELDIQASVMHSRGWHAVFDNIQFGRVPVVAALHGAVVGGGLELAAACHLRVADATAYFALPEGRRGIFVGGGGSARIPRLIGVARMTDLMLTGRVYDAAEGHAAGLTQYLVAEGQATARAIELADAMCGNAPMSNFAVMHALPRIAEQPQSNGLFTEALIAGAASHSPEAQARLKAFLEGRAAKVTK